MHACFKGPAKLPTHAFQLVLYKEVQFLAVFICFVRELREILSAYLQPVRDPSFK